MNERMKSATIPIIVECYEQVEFKGRKITVFQDMANLQDSLERSGFENRISSIRILKGQNFPPDGAEIVFYGHPDFEGVSLPIRMETMEYKKELPNLHPLLQNIGNSISSIKIEG